MSSVRSTPSIWCVLMLAATAMAGCGKIPDPAGDVPPYLEVEQAAFAASTEGDSGEEDDVDRNGGTSTEVDSLTRSGASARLGGVGVVVVRGHVLLDRIREYLASLQQRPGPLVGSGPCPDCGPSPGTIPRRRPGIAEVMCLDCILIFPAEDEPVIQPRFRVDEVPAELEPFFPGGIAVVCPDCVDVEITIDPPSDLGTITAIDLVHIPAGAFHPRHWSMTADGRLLITLVLPSDDLVPSDKAQVTLDLITVGPFGTASHTITGVPWRPVSVQPAEPFRVRAPDTTVH